MSQQMFEPQEGHNQQSQGWWAYASPRRDRKTREMPKNEHPATFEEPFANTSYEEGYQSQSQTQESEEQSYRPYNAYRPSGDTESSASYVAPTWARPQRNPVLRILGTIVGILLVAAIILKVIIPLFLVLFAIVALLIVFVGFLSLIFFVCIAGLLRLLGIPFHPFRLVRQWRRRRSGRWHGIYFDI